MLSMQANLEHWLDEALVGYDQSLEKGQIAWSPELPCEWSDLPTGVSRRLARARNCLLVLQCLRERPGALRDRAELAAAGRTALCSDCSLDRYQVVGVLGRGGFAVVYRATDVATGQQVALKIPALGVLRDEQRRRRFLTETRIVRQLEHPAITPVLDGGEANGIPYLVYSFCPGPSLAQWLEDRQCQPVNSSLAARIVLRLARALEYTHGQGVLHCDIKPANILCRPSHRSSETTTDDFPYQPELTDFGLAESLLDSPAAAGGPVAGTAEYMAPEQVSAGYPASPATDIYGLGIVLYELLTGRRPFGGRDTLETLRSVMYEAPRRPRDIVSHVDPDLESICWKCIDRDPLRRYQNARSLSADLQRYLNGQAGVAEQERSDNFRRRRRCRRLLVMVALWFAM